MYRSNRSRGAITLHVSFIYSTIVFEKSLHRDIDWSSLWTRIPGLVEVQFHEIVDKRGALTRALVACLSSPKLLALQFSSCWWYRHPNKRHTPLPISPALQSFSLQSELPTNEYGLYEAATQRQHTRESKWLEAIVSAYHLTLSSLELPYRSTPYSQMAAVPWPNLEKLVLQDRCKIEMDPPSFTPLLTQMPRLSHLEVLAPLDCLTILPPKHVRLAHLKVSEITGFDGIFACLGEHTLSLSICEWPPDSVIHGDNCLDVRQLHRSIAPCELRNLNRLELLYMVHDCESEDKFLDCIPKLHAWT